MKKTLALLAMLLIFAFISGCSGSSSATVEEPEPTGDSVGVFTDAPVQGLAYSAEPSGLSGFTNENGEFDYNEGDNVTFRLGSLVLGTVRAAGFVTPFDIADYDNAVDIARLLQSVGTVAGGVIVLNQQSGLSVSEIVSDNMTLRDALDALEAESVITKSAEEALDHMNAYSIYGAYAGKSAIRCAPGGFETADSVMLFDKGRTFAFNVGGYELPEPGEPISVSALAPTRKIGIYTGKRISQDSFTFTNIADESELLYTIAANTSEVFSTSISSPDNTCSGTGFMMRIADMRNDNESCPSPEDMPSDEDDATPLRIYLESSNVYDMDNYTNVPRYIELMMSLTNGCGITAEADYIGYDEFDNMTLMYEKSFKGYIDFGKKGIFLSGEDDNGTYSALMISINEMVYYEKSSFSLPTAVRTPYEGYYFEYAEDNETGGPLWSLYSLGLDYKR
ncbi:MAG: hypothetical protein AB7E48_06735 [Deferribacterales bacterium]